MTNGILGEAVKKEIQIIVEDVLDKKNEKLNTDEIKEIVTSLVPSLDSLISKQIKKHMVMIANFITEKFEGDM